MWYARREKTEFSTDVREVRQVAGCEGSHIPDNSRDVLIIGAGYEDGLVAAVAESKAKADKVQLYGFPSLKADMYQENILCALRAEESLGAPVREASCTHFAPANDPFVTASELSSIVSARRQRGMSNLYLCPLSTKAHVLGFAIFYVCECMNGPVSMLFPFEVRCSPSAATGLARIWKYSVELFVT